MSLPAGRFGNYVRGKELGHGASGRVFECRRVSEVPVIDLEDEGLERSASEGPTSVVDDKPEMLAVKVLDLRGMRLSANAAREFKKMQRELAILKSLPPHPGIVQLVDAVKEGDWMFIVLELMRGGDLFGILMDRPGPAPRLLEREASHVFWQLFEGLSFLHGHNVIHRDLKLENVLIASERRDGKAILYEVKISDFGLSKVVANGVSQACSTVGTKRYAAPEVLQGRAYDFQVDLWSMGILLYVLLRGRYPHDCPAGLKQADLNRIVEQGGFSKPACSIVTGLLQLDPCARTSLEQLRSITWVGEDACSTPTAQGPEAEQISTGSLFGSDDFPLPPPAPGASPLPSMSGLSTVGVGEQRGLVTQREPSIFPSAQSILALADNEIGECDASTAAPSASRQSSSIESRAVQDADSDGVASAGEPPSLCLRRNQAISIDLSNSRAASAGVHEMHTHLVVPDRFAGILIGKAGAKLKDVKACTGCNAWMTPRDGGAERNVVIVGSYVQCEQAQSMFAGYLADAMRAQNLQLRDVTVIVFVRKEVVGAIIGKQGTTLQRLRKQSGAKMWVLREEVDAKQPCIITGTLSSVQLAEKLIDGISQAARSPNPSEGGQNSSGRRSGDSSTAQTANSKRERSREIAGGEGEGKAKSSRWRWGERGQTGP
eukprot:TRINITY_DN57016_c0_g1_i1.p1 TRINITY_DN57016_c0_g1~~TRINITY_DN57016_c0_g1_i1.p1  ORF type:complete len:708 (+),score=69.65 TRINITY_DN57016_c0_g1_i1:146-2125(+)